MAVKEKPFFTTVLPIDLRGMVIEILVHLSAHKGFDCGQNERPHYISI